MQTEILERGPEADVAVYAIFFEVVSGDVGAKYSVDPDEILNDPRVTSFWDDERVAGRWFEDNVTRIGKRRGEESRVEWDAYFLYGRKASWTEDEAPRIWTWGRTIYSERERFRREIEDSLSKS